ncbi:MAG: WYL domain-containing protein [Mogibacterium sp.]|nr:WYL domain-containing protein [Mogibacterium sp.]
MGTERKGVNQKLKMLYLLKIFSQETDDNHALTMQEIIAKLEACGVNADRKTLYQDFDELRRFGLDIIASKSGRNFYYNLGSRDFELPELKLLVDSVQSSKFITDKKSAQLIHKLESLVSKYEGSQLHRQVLISGRVKTMNESIYYNVDKLHEAIGADRKIRFKYYDWNLRKEMEPRYDGRWYHMSPWALMWDDEKYYMVAYDSKHEDIIHYRVDKMMNIRLEDEPREGREAFREFNIAHYTNTLFGMYAGNETKVMLEAENHMVGVLIDRFGKDIIIVPEDDNHFRTTVTVAVSKQFFGWIAALDGEVRIVGPDSVVDQMREHMNKLAEQYRSTTPT